MDIIRDKNTLRDAIRALKSQGKRVAFVPTMGALHAGHISLIRLGLEQADAVVASVFVNPTQFGPNEDFSKYPRTEEADSKALQGAGTAIAYLPAVEQMYPAGASTHIHVAGVSEGLCGAFRLGHFDGVATIVAKLFMQAQPDVAIFGQKDYQQLAVIRRMVADLDLPIEIVGAPILREEDGLAMSSRNRYLSEKDRAIAPLMHRVLNEVAEDIQQGTEVAHALEYARKELLQGGFTKVDYVELCDAAILAPLKVLNTPARLLAAAYIGTTRLIDNIEVQNG